MGKAVKKSTGRPSAYNDKLADELCEIIATSGQSVRRLCATNPKFPSDTTFFSWLTRYPEFYKKYILAKQWSAERLIDEIVDIADDTAGDYTTNKDGKEVVSIEHIHRSRVRIDTRKFIAMKLLPKLYGDRPAAATDDPDSLAASPAAAVAGLLNAIAAAAAIPTEKADGDSGNRNRQRTKSS